MFGLASGLALPALAAAPPMRALTEGPFYPSRSWRAPWPDQDADLTRIQRPGGTGVARGEHLGLESVVQDETGRVIDGAEVEIWQCDVEAAYRHRWFEFKPGSHDENFQGFGATRSDAQGRLRFRTIKPVAYPGRTPHIHLKLRHASFGEFTTQLFVAGDPGNARDGFWRRLNDDQRQALEMQLAPAAADTGLRWMAQHALVVPS